MEGWGKPIAIGHQGRGPLPFCPSTSHHPVLQATGPSGEGAHSQHHHHPQLGLHLPSWCLRPAPHGPCKVPRNACILCTHPSAPQLGLHLPSWCLRPAPHGPCKVPRNACILCTHPSAPQLWGGPTPCLTVLNRPFLAPWFCTRSSHWLECPPLSLYWQMVTFWNMPGKCYLLSEVSLDPL